MRNGDIEYDCHALRRYLEAKLESAKELLEAGKISRAEAFRCEVDLSLMRDTGPIRFLEASHDRT